MKPWISSVVSYVTRKESFNNYAEKLDGPVPRSPVGAVSPRGCVPSGLCPLGAVSPRGCVPSGLCPLGAVSPRGCVPSGLFVSRESTLTDSGW